MAYRIDENVCIACGACEPVCPVNCITANENGIRVIAEDDCVNCGACAGVCPVECISEVSE